MKRLDLARFTGPLVIGLAVLVAVALPAAAATNVQQMSARITNPWFPLRPGTVFRYRGVEGGTRVRDVMTVLHRAVRVDGAPARVVVNRLYRRSHLLKTTRQWFSQDTAGNLYVVTAPGKDPIPFLPAHPRAGVSGSLLTERAARFPLDPSQRGLVQFHRSIGNTEDQTAGARYQLSLWSVTPLP